MQGILKYFLGGLVRRGEEDEKIAEKENI